MKKTIILTLSALAMSTMAQGAVTTYTATTGTSTISNAQYYGWALTLDAQLAGTITGLNTSSAGSAVTTLPSTLELNSISLKTCTGTTNTITSVGFKLAVYEFNYTANSGVQVGDFVGLSTNSISNTVDYGTAITFSFDSLSLDTSQSYLYLFVTESATGTNLAASETKSAWDNYETYATAVRISAVGITNSRGNGGAAGCWNYRSGNDDMQLHSSTRLPGDMTYSLSYTSAVPEPTTATLSLLALAGLASRRRRK